MKHISKIKRLLLTKKRKLWWNRKRSFFKNHRNCSLRTSTKGRPFWTFNSYSFNFNGGLCNRRTGFCPCQTLFPGRRAVYVIFTKWPLAISLQFKPFWLKQTFAFFYMQLVRSTTANMCPIMSHFNALDFSECRSEEVISFFWRSVYNFQIVLSGVWMGVRNWLCYIHWASKKTSLLQSDIITLKSTASKWFIFGHRLGKFILNKHI